MRFSTFIIIALLALIAYALLRPVPSPSTSREHSPPHPAPSPSALQELYRLAQQWIPPAKAGGQESQPAPEQPSSTPDGGGKGLPSSAQSPPRTSKSDAPETGHPSRTPTEVTWDPFTKDGNDTERRQITGRVRQHLDRDALLIRSGANPDSGSGEEYVLVGFPGATETPLEARIEFYAYSAGVATYENDIETKTVTVLVYSSGVDSKNQQAARNPLSTQTPPTPQTKQDTQPQKPGAWMWEQKTPLDRGPYNRR